VTFEQLCPDQIQGLSMRWPSPKVNSAHNEAN
jgi:hypothetical protein